MTLLSLNRLIGSRAALGGSEVNRFSLCANEYWDMLSAVLGFGELVRRCEQVVAVETWMVGEPP